MNVTQMNHEASLEAISSKLQELKNQITNLLHRLETEPDKVDRSSVLDHYTVITSQLSNLTRIIRHDKTPPLRNYSLFPLKLTPELDPELEHTTEGRLRIFNHEVAPDYLRTKLEPDVEQAESAIENRVSQLQTDTLQRQMNQLTKWVSAVCDMVAKFKVQLENENVDKSLPPTFNPDDTHTLLAAVNYGVNLRPAELAPGALSGAGPGAGGAPQPSPGGASAPITTTPPTSVNPNTVNKPAPPTVKTSIKTTMPQQFGR